jgi:transcriptional regulator with XRE-family HTH domain
MTTPRLPLETLGQRIARLRTQRGWTQQQLADRLAASRVAISHFEMGIALPSERTIVLMAGLFKVEPHELIVATSYPAAKADKLPSVALRYSEVELQLALLERDLLWAERLGKTTSAEVQAEWRPQLMGLLDTTTDVYERRLLHEALNRLH